MDFDSFLPSLSMGKGRKRITAQNMREYGFSKSRILTIRTESTILSL